MCVIAISGKGKRQPTEDEIYMMYSKNPHGAGYMFSRSGKVLIHKGFMSAADLIFALRQERFSIADAVVYHFRISTQGGISPGLTHPFPLTSSLSLCKALDLSCALGIAHNGIIPVTGTFLETGYSDTMLFIARYLSKIIRSRADLHNPEKIEAIKQLIGYSKIALLDSSGEVVTIGNFTDVNGILYSNLNHMNRTE